MHCAATALQMSDPERQDPVPTATLELVDKFQHALCYSSASCRAKDAKILCPLLGKSCVWRKEREVTLSPAPAQQKAPARLIMAFFAFLRAFASSGPQRWQNMQSTPALQRPLWKNSHRWH
jgi:hypothetical protein